MGKVAKVIGYIFIGWLISLFATGFNIGFLGAVNGWPEEDVQSLAKILYTKK